MGSQRVGHNWATEQITTKTINRMDGRQLWEMMKMFMAQIVVMVSQVYAYLQTHEVVYVKYVLLFMYQSYLNKLK